MLCQECRKRPANVHVTRITNGRRTELHLCQECARERGQPEFVVEPQFPIQSFLAGLLDPGAPPFIKLPAPATCAYCGLTYQEFARSGRLGCSSCYERFGERLDPVLRRIHGSSHHGGKVPTRSGGAVRLRRNLQELREALARAVQAEEFEKAAQLRDEIRNLEKELG